MKHFFVKQEFGCKCKHIQNRAKLICNLFNWEYFSECSSYTDEMARRFIMHPVEYMKYNCM